VVGRLVSNALSHLFARDGATRALERIIVWAHVLTILTFLAYLPHSKHLHIATCGDQRLLRKHRSAGRLEPLRFDEQDVSEEYIRFVAWDSLRPNWKQILDTYSCTECGRCQDACPAFATGKTLSPKLVIMGLRTRCSSMAQARWHRGGQASNSSSRRSCPARFRRIPSGIASLRLPRAGLSGCRSSTSTTSSISCDTW